MKPPPESKFLATLVRVRRSGGLPRWKNARGDRIYEWDGLHGEVEVYSRRGRHLGALDPATGRKIKDPVKGRTIDV